MDLVKLKQLLTDQPKFRLGQVTKNYFSGQFESFLTMTDLPLSLRQSLQDNLPYASIIQSQISATGKTQKALLTLSDNAKIETVLMDYDYWLTVCVSSQVGCPLACKFCATGQLGFKRNLTAEEIVDQIVFWNQKIYPRYVGRVVYMGMGEPFLNWDNLINSLKTIHQYLNIGSRKISISTAGVVPRILDFTKLDNQVNLAISLHSANQSVRASIMPITKQYPLDQLHAVCLAYVRTTSRQLFFEYAPIDGINDTPKAAAELIKFIQSHHLFYLNIINLNLVAGGCLPSTPANLKKFLDILTRAGVEYSVRRSFGSSINAACGQLAATSSPKTTPQSAQSLSRIPA